MMGETPGGAMVEGWMNQGAGQEPVGQAPVSWRPPANDQSQERDQAAPAGVPAPAGSYQRTLPNVPMPPMPPGPGVPPESLGQPQLSPPADSQRTLDLGRVAERADSGRRGLGPLYVVGDVHGYLTELRSALRANGLVDAEDHWSAGNTRLWFLGDFTDRGPDGVGVIDLVMQLSAEAAAAGGYVKALMGNHEVLILGAKRFGDTAINSNGGTASFHAAWRLNGGQPSDMERLQPHHITWMSRLDAAALEDDHLLLHSDTPAYFDYGDTIEAVNDAVHEVLGSGDAEECWELFRKLTKRFAFRGELGSLVVRDLLECYGGERLVHGHSPIPYLLGVVGSEDGEAAESPTVDGPHVYADDLAVAMDGGVTMDGPLLITQLPLNG